MRAGSAFTSRDHFLKAPVDAALLREGAPANALPPELAQFHNNLVNHALPQRYQNTALAIGLPAEPAGAHVPSKLRQLVAKESSEREIKPFSEEELGRSFRMSLVPPALGAAPLGAPPAAPVVPGPAALPAAIMAPVMSTPIVKIRVAAPQPPPVKQEGGGGKKKRKREPMAPDVAHSQEALQAALLPVVTDLIDASWGADGNPFAVRITRENYEAIGLAGYFTFVDEPMDLTLMRDKLMAGQYATINQLRADLDLLVSNAHKYNPESSPFHGMATSLKQEFDRKIARVIAGGSKRKK